jgi:hypothetical protein
VIQITADLEPIQRLRLHLTQLRTLIQRPRGITQTVAEGVKAQTLDRLHNTKTDPSGRRWAPWSRAYARTRNPGAGHSLLKDTWAMADGVKASSTPTTSKVTVPAPAAYHDSDEPRSRLPQRKILGLSNENVADLERWLGPALEDVARGIL